MRPESTRRGGPGVPARAADQRGGAAVPGRCRGRAAAHRGRERAKQIAEELGRANSERRATEREVDAAAETARRELPDELKEANGLVRGGGGVAPRRGRDRRLALVERHHRPVVVISLDEEGGGRGSGRSIPGFDLHAALEACSEHLETFGGHKAAAGLSIKAENLEAFRAAFAAHADEVLSEEDLKRTERIDAMVGGVGLGLDLAEELGQLAPFGMGNPGVRLMVPSARVTDVRTMGEEGKHSRFSLHSGSHRALGRGLRPHQLRRRRRRHARRRGAARGQPLERRGRAPRRPPRGLPARRGDPDAVVRRTPASATKPSGGRASRPSSVAT